MTTAATAPVRFDRATTRRLRSIVHGAMDDILGPTLDRYGAIRDMIASDLTDAELGAALRALPAVESPEATVPA